ncbi:MAG: HEAT repeat domain-containing protein [Proteobacteria bacterium]|nr:HEAT repeat domain-containing protein [Pseudomonadota bacterium]
MTNPKPPSSASHEPVDPLVATKLGNYRLSQRIGEGGMGVIYRATHALIGRQAAIKVLSSAHSSNPSVIERFHREARAASRLGHPHIIDVFDFGQTPDGREYYVMEYLPGENLGEVFARRGRLPWHMLQPIIGQTLSALAAAHDHGIIHRDIKPENILVSHQPDDTLLVKVVDFGIAKSLELGPEGTKLTAAGSVMGTPEYIAPEQIRDQAIDGRADLYAVGLIVFEALMGRQPYSGPDSTALLLAHLRDPLPPLQPLPAELGAPADITEVLARATAKDPRARFPDAQSFARAIGYEDLARNRRPGPNAGPRASNGASRARPGGGPSLGRWRPSWRGGVGVALAGAAAALVAALALHRRQPHLAGQRQGASILVAAPTRGGDRDPAAIDAPNPGADELAALLVDVRRALRQGMRATEAELRRSSVRGLAELRDSDTAALLGAALLDDPDPGVRGAAALALAAVGGDDLAATLRGAARQSAGLPRLQILEALWHAGHDEGRRELVQTLGSDTAELRLSAALTLAEAGEPRAQAVLRRALAAPGGLDPAALIAVLRALATLGSTPAMQSLLQAVQRDDRPLVQLGAAEALVKLGRPEGTPALRRLAQQPDPALRLMAAQVLTGLGDALGPSTLRASLRDATPSTRALVARGLAAWTAPGAVAALATLLRDGSPLVRTAAAEALARLFAARPQVLVRRGQQWVQAALERGDWAMRYAALDVARELDPELAAELLGWALQHGDAGLRSVAARRLGELRPPAAKASALLHAALEDRAVEVRAAAALALAEAGDAAVAPVLSALTRDHDPQIALSAAAQLWRAGDGSHAAALVAAARATDARVRKAAISALARLPRPEARALIVAALGDRSADVRYAAALALAGKGARPDALRELRRALSSRHGDPLAIVRALARAGDDPQGLLGPLARDRAAGRRAAAQRAAAELLSPAAALALLRRGAQDSDAEVRRASAHGLLRLASSTPRAAAALRQLAGDPDPAVRVLAALALARTRETPAPRPRGQPRAAGRAAAAGGTLVGRGADAELSEDQRYGTYKAATSRAALALNQGRFAEALRELQRARRALDRPAALYDLGFVHLKLAQRELVRRPRVAARELNRAARYFAAYLARAPHGPLAHNARGAERDVARLRAQLKP